MSVRNAGPAIAMQWCANATKSHWHHDGAHKDNGFHIWQSVTIGAGAVLTFDDGAINGVTILALLDAIQEV